MTKPRDLLVEKLEPLLPKGFKFGVYHLSTPPTRTEALYSAPPGERPDKTYREDHFLAISIDVEPGKVGELDWGRRVLVLALEVFLFTTAFSTTLFVSKADSTGYLHLLDLPKGCPSPTRGITTAFVSFLVEHRQRQGIPTVVSLFARAQSQYLFPGSVDNEGKHVLDDRGLVKWWCRVLNPLLDMRKGWGDIRAYLVVPGLDHYETRAFLPRTPGAAANWTLGHPLERISHYTGEYDSVPLRCLIPRFPDDPKSRFRDELDVEVSKSEQDTGVWKSVKTLDQFWEMMAFRQECSSGRLTGFIWVVFDPEGSKGPTSVKTPTKGQNEERKVKKQKKLKGLIVPREPKIKTQQRNYLLECPTSTAYYYWPPEGRGDKIVDETSYKRIVELLLHLDFATLDKACGSTARWISEVAVGTKWGTEVVGSRVIQAVGSTAGEGKPAAAVNDLAGLVKRKRAEPAAAATGGGTHTEQAPVNVLGAGLVRKKTKEDAPEASSPAVNVLGAGLVRKKPKVRDCA